MPDQPDPRTPEAQRVQLLALIAQLDAEAIRRLHAFLVWWTTRPGPET
jgi:hypothetical protein